MATYRILVTGSRGWRDRDAIAWQLGVAAREGQLLGREVVVVHGACPEGADALADEAARAMSLAVEPHRAEWGRKGGGIDRSAGYRRNELMVGLGADVCLAFAMRCVKARCRDRPAHSTHGTAHCARVAAAAGIPVRELRGG